MFWYQSYLLNLSTSRTRLKHKNQVIVKLMSFYCINALKAYRLISWLMITFKIFHIVPPIMWPAAYGVIAIPEKFKIQSWQIDNPKQSVISDETAIQWISFSVEYPLKVCIRWWYRFEKHCITQTWTDGEGLTVLHLLEMIENIIHMIKGEDIEILAAVFRLIIIIQEHLPHIMHRNGPVNRTI